MLNRDAWSGLALARTLLHRVIATPTFADATARSRQHPWFERIVTSAGSADMTEPVSPATRRIIETACHAQ